MSGSRGLFRLMALLCLSFTLPGFAAALSGGDAPQRIPVSGLTATPVSVASWDSDSPQQLVRIDSILYQQDAGFYYPVIDDRITVRLVDGVRNWATLVDRAVASEPQTFGDLATLVPLRRNRLGIFDVAIPDGDPTRWCELVFSTGLVKYAEVSTIGVYTATANDPLYPQQWALNNTGQTGGTPGADIKAEAAWDVTSGTAAIQVAVLDSGTSIDHVDLAANVWHNEDEIPGNGVDDDNNGFIDDWEGWDFGNNNNDPRSNSFHGTHVTGIINAVSNNNIGISGLAGGLDGPGVQGMALAVGESAPIGSILDDALIYAADNGADVVTMSLVVGETSAINDALDYAYNTKDVFIDCAAGNGPSSVGYPARRSEVMAVASSDHNDNRSPFSNTGPELEVTAPGSNILSTQLNNSYGTSSGTSFAAPYVAALAGLIRGLNPGSTAPEVRQLLMDTADDIGPVGFDNLTGWGRINAFQAVSLAGLSDGFIEIDADLYSCDATLTATVTDFDLGSTSTVLVTLRSELEPAGETVILHETTFGVFSGNLTLASDAPQPDGRLQVAHDDTVTAEYLDADDGQGGIDVLKSDTARTDCLAPAIFDVATEDVEASQANITWATDEDGTSIVRYGETAPPTQEASSPGMSQLHSVQLLGLEACTNYLFEVESTDGVGNIGLDANGGMFYILQTPADAEVGACQLGQAALDSNIYGCDGTVQVTVADIGPNTNPGVAETIQVLMTSTSEPTGEWISLTANDVDSPIFEGSITLQPGPPGEDGVLSAGPLDLITVTYYDADDGLGESTVATYTATADCVAPEIQDLQVTAISSTRAVIEWTTDEPATSRVEFGPDASLGSVVEDLTAKNSHGLMISAFEACERIHFRVSSADVYGDVQVADVSGQPFQFNLNQIGGLVFHDNFEAAAGWNLEGEWEIELPQALGSGSGDPAVAFSGAGVIGTDLSGTGVFPGDYEPGAQEWARSPLFNAVGSTNLELIVQRKLGVAASASAKISVLDGTEQVVWTSAGDVDDAGWVEVRYDISGLADGKPAVQVAFAITSGLAGQQYGWNIDELIVKDATEPDYLGCGGCTDEPAFAGIVAAFDAEPCGGSGLTLEWEPAPAWGGGSSGSYDVHRGAAPDFLPDAANRVAGGLTDTTWIDQNAPLDTEVWYVVRARNDESCTGGEGLSDGNLVRLSATETVSQSPAVSVGQSVRVLRVGGAHVRLSWDAAPGADHYLIRRSDLADFSNPQQVGSTAATFFEDPNAAADDGFYAYRVFAVNACDLETP